MLTWSDWKTEPRSNRYHYATRFARELPVLFVQPDSPGMEISSEAVPGTNIEIIHVPGNYGPVQSAALDQELKRRRIFRPLLWIYNVFFEHFVDASNANLKIYHATEDYFTPPKDWAAGDDVVRAPLIRLLKGMDLVVAVSDGVAESYRNNGEYRGRILVLPNGCDFTFWDRTKAADHQPPPNGSRVALFQGGINGRLDFELLIELANHLMDWEFWFCGHDTNGGPGWDALRRLSNVRYLGQLTPEEIAQAARQSAVGLIPFKQDELIRRSLPLKAYEYAACGLPTVTVPIDALASYSSVFTQARTALEFGAAIRALAPFRTEPKSLEERLAVAADNSYDKHFQTLIGTLLQLSSRTPREKLNVLVLYDSAARSIPETREALLRLERSSFHNISFLCARSLEKSLDSDRICKDIEKFDAVLVHEPVLVAHDGSVRERATEALGALSCLKIVVADPNNLSEVEASAQRSGTDAILTTEAPSLLTSSPARDERSSVELVIVPQDQADDRPLMQSARIWSLGGSFIDRLDAYLTARLGRKAKSRLVQVAVLANNSSGGLYTIQTSSLQQWRFGVLDGTDGLSPDICKGSSQKTLDHVSSMREEHAPLDPATDGHLSAWQCSDYLDNMTSRQDQLVTPAAQPKAGASLTRVGRHLESIEPALKWVWHTLPAPIRTRFGPFLRRHAVVLHKRARVMLR